MGWSIHDIGPRLRWSDVATIVRHLPASSHFQQARHPDRADLRYTDPHGELLSMVVDELVRLRMQQRGAEAPEPLLRRLRGDIVREGKQDTPVKPRRRQSAASVRERMAALYNH